LLIYAFPTFPLDTFRILGVLQRIAICYLVAGFVFLNTSVRGQIAVTAALMGSYWAIMSLGDWSVEGNISHYVDRMVLGAHNYHNTKTWDPEGIVSTLPAIATCLLGIFAGHILRSPATLAKKVERLVVIGIVLIAAGLALDTVMPINKKLWTDSFTLLMGGLDFAVFGALLWLIDEKKITAPFRPAMVMGMNAIALYLSSEFIEIILDHWHWKEPLYQAVFAPLASPMNASLLYAVTYVLLHLGIAYALYSRKLFFRA
jgi:predicted acyltransferase